MAADHSRCFPLSTQRSWQSQSCVVIWGGVGLFLGSAAFGCVTTELLKSVLAKIYALQAS